MEYKNNKNGDIYQVVDVDVICSTNGRENERGVYFKKGDKTFYREKKEFFNKFTKISHPGFTDYCLDNMETNY